MPPCPGVDGRRTDRAQSTADRIEKHVKADQPAMRFGPGAEDHDLVGYVQRLATHVQKDDPDRQHP